MIRRPPRSTHCISSAASDVYKRQVMSTTRGANNYFPRIFKGRRESVSYTHLTLPTICSVQISVVAVSLKKKKKKYKDQHIQRNYSVYQKRTILKNEENSNRRNKNK
eukprot:TRINITY_DN9458_c0_g1_i5.p3 TRINITY_DN9458_c0_g1~~TRINITY_DN9458_c0_g1_i5.p3  ORF type:complete len:107 (-),score=29.37 TRINITY_DN9458_c0_g1_i5:24-344(-)